MYWFVSRYHYLYNNNGNQYGWGNIGAYAIMNLVKRGNRIELLAPADRRKAGGWRLADNLVLLDTDRTPVSAREAMHRNNAH